MLSQSSVQTHVAPSQEHSDSVQTHVAPSQEHSELATDFS